MAIFQKVGGVFVIKNATPKKPKLFGVAFSFYVCFIPRAKR